MTHDDASLVRVQSPPAARCRASCRPLFPLVSAIVVPRVARDASRTQPLEAANEEAAKWATRRPLATPHLSCVERSPRKSPASNFHCASRPVGELRVGQHVDTRRSHGAPLGSMTNEHRPPSAGSVYIRPARRRASTYNDESLSSIATCVAPSRRAAPAAPQSVKGGAIASFIRHAALAVKT